MSLSSALSLPGSPLPCSLSSLPLCPLEGSSLQSRPQSPRSAFACALPSSGRGGVEKLSGAGTKITSGSWGSSPKSQACTGRTLVWWEMPCLVERTGIASSLPCFAEVASCTCLEQVGTLRLREGPGPTQDLWMDNPFPLLARGTVGPQSCSQLGLDPVPTVCVPAQS